MLAYLMLHFDKKRLLEHPRREDTTPPTMQKIPQRRSYIVLPFDPLLGGGDMVALVLIDNGCSCRRSNVLDGKWEIKQKFERRLARRRTTASLPAKIRLKSLDLNFTPKILSSFHVSEQKLLISHSNKPQPIANLGHW